MRFAMQAPAARKLLLIAALSAALVVPSYASAAQAGGHSSFSSGKAGDSSVSSAEYSIFLQDKFGITLSASVTKGEFLNALVKALGLAPSEEPVAFADLASTSPYYSAAKALYQHGVLTSDTVNALQPLSAVNAVQIALKAADLKELAYSYPETKAAKSLGKLPVKAGSLSLQAKQELAAAVDTQLLPAAYYSDLQPNARATSSLVSTLIGKVLSFKGEFKHYIGYASDADIYLKLTDAFRSSVIIRSEELQKIVDTALENNLVTGYNLKDSAYEANFVDSLSLVYGHSDLTHAVQLIGLLNSEGIDAKVQLEPKTSAFVYLKEWGDPGQSDLYEVRQIANGNYIEYAKEYDIAFEFDSAADKQRFNDIILSYAKKNQENPSGLIYGSWWQPLYYSLTALPEYQVISNNKIQLGRYYAQSFSLKEQSQAVIDGFKSIDPSVTVEHYDFWVDAPFYRYLNGESL
ncbi:hypothetical protein [Cohnella sp. AR92]|uniref:hypothetical protein n=1 Tax=Cohnella sp. AR92 TaxID=648716 RepID=UPI000F8CC1FE|nr:hypothetical protein [Cohnella sp. AR92]RUS45656.1 hypothetical protein ELR57_17460 [Cohnella sp. AR92]